jgi:hypothetical protein
MVMDPSILASAPHRFPFHRHFSISSPLYRVALTRGLIISCHCFFLKDLSTACTASDHPAPLRSPFGFSQEPRTNNQQPTTNKQQPPLHSNHHSNHFPGIVSTQYRLGWCKIRTVHNQLHMTKNQQSQHLATLSGHHRALTFLPLPRDGSRLF